MRKFFALVILGLCGALSVACSVSAGDANNVFDPLNNARSLTMSSEPLAGKVDGKTWRLGPAVAELRNGEYEVTIAGEGVDLSCAMTFPMAPHISFIVPKTTGTFAYDASQTTGGRLVNFNFPYTTTNGGGSDNVLGVKSIIKTTSIAGDQLVGQMAALSAPGADRAGDHGYDISGTFSAKICGATAAVAPLSILKHGAVAFTAVYSEAVETQAIDGSYYYAVRLMDRVPSEKCQHFSGWMHVVSPIKYVEIRAPKRIGSFNLQTQTVEYGELGAGGGWSVDTFSGQGSVASLTATAVSLSLSASELQASGVVIKGQTNISICQQ